MKNYVLHSTLEFVLVRENSWMGFCNTIVSCFELFIDDHEGKDNLMMIDRVFDRVSIECCLQIFKPVIELSYIAIISKLGDVGGVKLDAPLAQYWLRTH